MCTCNIQNHESYTLDLSPLRARIGAGGGCSPPAPSRPELLELKLKIHSFSLIKRGHAVISSFWLLHQLLGAFGALQGPAYRHVNNTENGHIELIAGVSLLLLLLL